MDFSQSTPFHASAPCRALKGCRFFLILFPSPAGNRARAPSDTFARLPLLVQTNRAKVHRSKKQSCKGLKPFSPIRAIFQRRVRRSNRAKVQKKPAVTGFMTKKNCTAVLTHIVSKLPCSYGGEGGIRTLETLLTPTRFPVARPRPS